MYKIINAKSPGFVAAHTVEVDADSAGQRLDNFLLRQLKGVPKTHVYRLIRGGEVRLNKGRASADTRVAAGDQVRVPPLRLPTRASTPGAGTEAGAGAAHAVAAPAREFVLLYEDDHVLALDKPSGLAVHGGSGVAFGVIEQLRRARPQARFLELVHRLDRETSGVLLVAKKGAALKNLQAQFRARSVSKTYLSLVSGVWPAGQTVIDLALHKYTLPGAHGSDGERRVRVVSADDPQGQRAISLVRLRRAVVLPGLPQQAMSLLEVTIKTGRTHQIRVHLAAHGCPIAGDDKYGDFALNKSLAKHGLKRMFLHAWQLKLSHPATGEPLALESALPPELAQLL